MAPLSCQGEWPLLITLHECNIRPHNVGVTALYTMSTMGKHSHQLECAPAVHGVQLSLASVLQAGAKQLMPTAHGPLVNYPQPPSSWSTASQAACSTHCHCSVQGDVLHGHQSLLVYLAFGQRDERGAGEDDPVMRGSHKSSSRSNTRMVIYILDTRHHTLCLAHRRGRLERCCGTPGLALKQTSLCSAVPQINSEAPLEAPQQKHCWATPQALWWPDNNSCNLDQLQGESSSHIGSCTASGLSGRQ